MKISFKNWLIRETQDIFGFQKINDNTPDGVESEDPIDPISIELVMNELLRMPLNEHMPFSKFVNQIQWGRNNGAIQMVVSPLGSFKSIIRGMQTDLEGNQVWICKNILPYKDIMHANIEIDENLAHMLFEKIQQASQKQLESAIGNYTNLENLVLKLTNETQRKKIIPEIFIFRGVKEMKHNEHYIIHYECRGQGVEAPGSARLEMFAIEMVYSPKTGLIRSFGHDVQSPKKGHVWYPQPSEWDEYFSPAQPVSEIVDCICSALSTY
jgi:hypothetical protein